MYGDRFEVVGYGATATASFSVFPMYFLLEQKRHALGLVAGRTEGGRKGKEIGLVNAEVLVKVKFYPSGEDRQ